MNVDCVLFRRRCPFPFALAIMTKLFAFIIRHISNVIFIPFAIRQSAALLAIIPLAYPDQPCLNTSQTYTNDSVPFLNAVTDS